MSSRQAALPHKLMAAAGDHRERVLEQGLLHHVLHPHLGLFPGEGVDGGGQDAVAGQGHAPDHDQAAVGAREGGDLGVAVGRFGEGLVLGLVAGRLALRRRKLVESLRPG